jgi:hypothetical protein
LFIFEVDMSLSSYITTAMVAWNEIYQGYPDHWVKVYGNLNSAIDICNDEGLKKELKEESDQFYDSYKKNIKYRPKFEELACKSLNLETESLICGNVISGMLCYDCAIKHISDANVYYMQLSSDPDSMNDFMMVIGNLSHAADHLIEQYDELANFIREERKNFYNSYLVNRVATYRPNFEEMTMKVMSLMETV